MRVNVRVAGMREGEKHGQFPLISLSKPHYNPVGNLFHRSPPVCLSGTGKTDLSVFRRYARKRRKSRKSGNVENMHNVDNQVSWAHRRAYSAQR